MANEFLDNIEAEIPVKHMLFLDAFLVSLDIEQTLDQLERLNITQEDAEAILNNPQVEKIVEEELGYRLTALRATEARTTVNIMGIAYNDSALHKDRLKALQLLYQYKHDPARQAATGKKADDDGKITIEALLTIGKKMQGRQ